MQSNGERMLELKRKFGKAFLTISMDGEDDIEFQQYKKLHSTEGEDTLEHFQLIMEYAEQKGIPFQQELYKVYKTNVNYLLDLKEDFDITDIPDFIFEDILDLFDFEEFKMFITTKIKRVPEKFEVEYVKTFTKVEERTYLKHEYIEFITFIHLVNALSPIMSLASLLGTTKSGKLALSLPWEYIAGSSLAKQPIYDKIMGNIEIIIHKAQKDLLVIKEGSIIEEFTYSVTMHVLFGPMALYDFRTDDSSKNIITKFNSILSNKPNIGKIMERNTKLSADEEVSPYDAVQTVYDITGATVEEIMLITEDLYRFASQYMTLTDEQIRLLEAGYRATENTVVPRTSLAMAGFALRDYLPAQAMIELGAPRVGTNLPMNNSIRVCLATAFMLCYPIDPILANIIISSVEQLDGIGQVRVVSLNKLKMLDIKRIFPLDEGKSDTSYIAEAIKRMGDDLISRNLISNLDPSFGQQHFVEIPPALKTMILNMYEELLRLEEVRLLETS